LQAGGTGPELFCLCGISLYRELADALAPGLRVCAVFVTEELAMFGGTGGGEAAPDIPRLARAYLDAIRRRQPQGPYRLLGFSFGGVVAFEVAQQLRSQGEEVELLAILDSDVPGTATATLGGRLRRLGRLVTSLGRRLLPTGEAPEGPMLDERSYITAMRRYQPRGYSGSTLYVKSSERNSYDPGYGWNRLLGAPRWVALRESHLGILKGASAGRIATELRELLR
jgi:pimeloyl-ACP methyl ester carboxylesterase